MIEKKVEGPQRTSVCEAGVHEIPIEPNSILAIAWEMDQVKGKAGPLIIPDISCHLCHPRSQQDNEEQDNSV